MSYFRSLMSLADGVAYFDNAAVAPLTTAAKQAILNWTEENASRGDAHWPQWRTQVEKTRKLAASLLNASREEVAFTHSTTEGINFVAEGFPWKEGDNVVIPTGEFPTNLFPWKMLARLGVELRQVPMPSNEVDLEKLASACDARTRLISCSWVGYSHGYRVDLNELCQVAHNAGAYLMLDAIQGLGVFPIDVQQTPIDFLSADGHKWMLGPEGAGLFYLRKEHLDLLRPMSVGWNSVATAGDFNSPCMDLRKAASRYEGGTYNMVGLMGMGASLQVMLDYGIEAINQDLRAVHQEIISRLQAQGAIIHSNASAEHWSGIISFDIPGKDPLSVKQAAAKQDIYFNTRNDHFRLSPHAYTTTEDIDRLMESLFAENV
ncbi:MAG: aminotransferase class V-fold PLP-dependent enzyme [Planctomycetaceae bacterium]|nr:aminotransferase class V-fold PLP-dependent enzyme [Planctomycetaceae bacterium]